MRNTIKVKGFFRAQIVNKRGKIVGDSGWRKNQITNNGWNSCLVAGPIGAAGSYKAAFGALGTGTDAIASDATAVVGTLNSTSDAYIALATSVVSSKTARVTFQHDGSLGSGNVAQEGLFSGQTSGGMVCGNSFNSSALGAAQSINITHELRFS